MLKSCALCNTEFTDSNTSKEHIILNAIGGKKTVKGFICKTCNEEYGRTWDSELANQLHMLSLLLNIKRQKQRGETPRERIKTLTGDDYDLNNNYILTHVKPKFQKLPQEDNKLHIKFSVRSEHELESLKKQLKKKYGVSPELISINETLSEPQEHVIPLHSTIGGRMAICSMIKSLLALISEKGLNPRICNTAYEFIKNVDSAPCFTFYYQNDLIPARYNNEVFHCVHFKADPLKNNIIGYIEFFSLYRFIFLLSDSYSGELISETYAINPQLGIVMTPEVNFNCSTTDILRIITKEQLDEDKLKEQLSVIYKVINKTSETIIMNREIEKLCKKHFSNSESTPSTQDILQNKYLWADFAKLLYDRFNMPEKTSNE